jgi:hypothetical protein
MEKITGNGSSRKKLGVGKKMAGWVFGNRVQDTTKYWWMVKGMFRGPSFFVEAA